MPRESRISLSTGLPHRRTQIPVRWVCPMKSCVIPRDLANSRIVSTGSSPSRISTRAPAAWATAKRPDAEIEVLDWYRIASTADWSCFADVRRTFPRADLIGEVLVFDLGRNRYRLRSEERRVG